MDNIILPYKVKTERDAAAIYAPYIPLQASTTPYIPTAWERIGIDGPTGKTVYGVRYHKVWEWVESQPIHMWKHYDISDTQLNIRTAGHNYLFTEEMESWFLLRWS